METLTNRQRRVLDLIREVIEDTGMPPTRAEIARRLGFSSPNAAEQHLRALARKGVIEILSGTSRGIRLLESAGVPVVGRVAAGAPILAEEHIEDHYQIDPRLFRPRPHYLLRVRGASMVDAGIHHHDLLAVHRADSAENGQIIVARIDDEVTVKEFRRRGNIVTLIPHNPAFEPLRIDLRRQELAVEGLGVGIIRHKVPG